MPGLATTLSVVLAVFVGAALVRFCHYAEHRLLRDKAGTGFLDVVVPGDDVKYSDFVWIALPPIAGGTVLAFWPATNGGSAGAAGLLAGFLAVWPVYRFPVQLLREDIQPFWPKLKFLYGLFVGVSAALTYLGFIVVDRILPVAGTLARARLWVEFLNTLIANAVYAPAKYALAGVLAIGAVYVNREWVRIAEQVNGVKHELPVGEAFSQPPSRDA